MKWLYGLAGVLTFIFGAVQGTASWLSIKDRFWPGKGVANMSQTWPRIRSFIKAYTAFFVLAFTLSGGVLIWGYKSELSNIRSHPELAQNLRIKLTKPFATSEDLSKDVISGKTVFISDLALNKDYDERIVGGVMRVLGKSFEDCDIVGPHVIVIDETDAIIGKMTISNDPKSTVSDFLLVMSGNFVFGVIPFQHCGFQNCQFWEVGFAGPEDRLKKIFQSHVAQK